MCLGAAFAPRLRTPWESVYHCFSQWSLDGTFRKGEPPDPPVAGRARLGRNPEKNGTDLWAEEEWAKEGREIDWQRLLPPLGGFEVLPRRWL